MPIVIVTANGVFVDGSRPISFQPTVQTKHVAKGTDVTIRCTVRNSAGTLVNLADAACVLSVKQFETDPTPLFARLGSVIDAAGGVVDFEIGANDTIVIGEGAFVYDVVVTFPNSNRAQVVPVSNFIVDASANDPRVMPTIQLPSQQGQGGKLLGTDGAALLWRNADGTFNPRGAWVSGLAWAVDDVLTYLGSTYRCKLDIDPSNVAPDVDTTHFQLWAAKGTDGAEGPPGPAAPGIIEGSASLPGNGAWVELARYVPGANKIGFIDLTLRARTTAPSKVTAWAQVGVLTNNLGRVFLQSSSVAPIGGTIPTYSGAGVPGKPTGLSDTPGDGTETLSFANDGEVNGAFAEVSTDGGTTWVRVTASATIENDGEVVVQIDDNVVPKLTPVKFRVKTFNAFGESPASDPIDVTTGDKFQGGSGGFPLPPYYPVRQVQWDDQHPYWLNFIEALLDGNIDIVLVPDVGSGSEETDVVLKARTRNAKTAGITFRLTYSNGTSV